MLKYVILAAAYIGSFAVLDAASREVYYAGTAGGIIPTFDKGYLVQYPYAPTRLVNVFAPGGGMAFTAQIEVSGARSVSAANAAVDTDSRLAVPVGYTAADGNFRSGIAFFESNGTQSLFVETTPFAPRQVAFGPDHALWAVGWQRGNRQDYMILRRYRNGKEVGAYLPRSTFPPGLDPAPAILGSWHLRVISDRVGALLVYGKVEKDIWVELDLDGNLTGKWDVELQKPVAFTTAGQLYQQTWRGKEPVLTLLDRNTGLFHPVDLALPADAGLLVGADGNDLVFQNRDRFLWLSAPPN